MCKTVGICTDSFPSPFYVETCRVMYSRTSFATSQSQTGYALTHDWHLSHPMSMWKMCDVGRWPAPRPIRWTNGMLAQEYPPVSCLIPSSSIGNGSGERKAESPKAVAPTTAGPGYHLAPGKNTLESHRRLYQQETTMSSEAETQQQPQPAADAESPSSPAAAASAGDKKVIGELASLRGRFTEPCVLWDSPRSGASAVKCF